MGVKECRARGGKQKKAAIFCQGVLPPPSREHPPNAPATKSIMHSALPHALDLVGPIKDVLVALIQATGSIAVVVLAARAGRNRERRPQRRRLGASPSGVPPRSEGKRGALAAVPACPRLGATKGKQRQIALRTS